MSFKENLLKKIQIDKMAGKVLSSIGPPDGSRRIDKQVMRSLIEMGPRKFRKERDIDLYILEADPGDKNILVLDNDLAIYNTEPEDVGLRKSPTVREMISIRNVIRILNDGDVIISKKEESVRTVRKECLRKLDLSFDESDVEAIEKDGQSSLESGYTDGVIESLSFFAEFLGYASPPKVFRMSNYKIICVSGKNEDGETVYGPLVIYSIVSNIIKLIDEKIRRSDKERTEFVHRVAMGKEDASQEGTAVFNYLREAVMKHYPALSEGKRVTL
ncbi:hypothetical protein QUF80_19505 [Desulfococcaceae bacterium HSG8]|nr:hypothetical protein [Desulfococcaceae bacterium HSG8]